ncbi:MAG: S41 family peptidase [Pseudomonadota bacterium]
MIAALSRKLAERYVFPEKATAIGEELTRRDQSGDYAETLAAADFAARLKSDLREVGDDLHFGVSFDPDFVEPSFEAPRAPTAEEIAQQQALHQRNGYGIERVERLSGNIGYLKVRGFMSPEFTAAAYEAAISLIAGSHAIIVDLRSNNGGDPQSVAQLMSHFFARGDQRHLNSIYHRPSDTTREFWTNPAVQTRYQGPVYVLTSRRTFSAGEEFAYDMQTHKRGTLVGETTAGAANPGGVIKLAHGFTAFIPDGLPINPITGTNWEHVGVSPDRATAASEAMSAAYRAALKAAMANEAEPQRKARLAKTLDRFEAGKVNLPQWANPTEN